MKHKGRILGLLLAACLMVGLWPITALADEYADDGYGTIVRVANTEIWNQNNNNTTYWTCTDNALTQADAASAWNVKYDPTTKIMTLNGFHYEGAVNGIRSSVPLTIELQGENSITNTQTAPNSDQYNENHCIFVKDDLTIKGTETATLTVASTNGNGIMACHPALSGNDRHTENIIIQNATVTASADGGVGIVASQALKIEDSDIKSTGTNYGMQGGGFTPGSTTSITISNSTITAKATGSGGKAFHAAPTISDAYQWRDSDNGSWSVLSDSSPDFSQAYLELMPGTSADPTSHSHPVCGANCSHSGAHNGVTWTGTGNLTNDMATGSYYLTGNVTLTEAWKPANDITLCLNGYNIIANHSSYAIKFEYPHTFTLTDCSTTTQGKITHADGQSGTGVEAYREFTMYGGEISGNGTGVAVAGTFTLYGGSISQNTGLGVGISSNNDNQISGVFTMKGGTIEGNTGDTGGGVFAYASSPDYKVQFIMEEGSIKGNTAVMGGGVFISGAEFIMKGGSIRENNVTGDGSNGGGVILLDGQYSLEEDSYGSLSPVFHYSGGEISGNVKDGTLSGSSFTGGTANNVYLTATRVINVSGTPTGTGKIGVTTETTPEENTPVAITGNNSGDVSSYFASDNTDYEPFSESNVVKLRVKEASTTTPDTTAPSLQGIQTNRTGDSTATVKFTSTEAGTYYYKYQHTGAGLAPEASYVKQTGTSASCLSGENTLSLTGLSSGPFEIFIVTEDAAGNMSSVLTISIAAYTAPETPDYGILLNPTFANFALTVGYSDPPSETITVTNIGANPTGELTVKLNGTDQDKFTLSTDSITSIPAGGSAEFTIAPKPNRPIGTYYDVWLSVINTSNNISGRLNVSFSVSPQRPVITGTLTDATYVKGAQASPLTISASVTDGGTLSYQWLIDDGSEIARLVSGATNPSFTPPTNTVGTVTYYCSVTNSLSGHKSSALAGPVKITVTESSGDSGNSGGSSSGGNSGGSSSDNSSATDSTQAAVNGTAPTTGTSSGSTAGSSKTSDARKAGNVITVPVSGGKETVRVEASVAGSAATVTKLTDSALERVLGIENATGQVLIDLTGLERKIDTVNLPVDTLTAILKASEATEDAEDAQRVPRSLVLQLSTGTVTLNDKILRAVAEQAEGDEIRLVLDDAGLSRLNNVQKEAISDLDIYTGIEAYLLSVKTNTRIGDFQGGTATLQIPFEIPEGLIAAGFSVWYVDDEGGTEQFDTWHENGHLVWDVSHFSDFVIAYAQPEEAAKTETVIEELTPEPEVAETQAGEQEERNANSWLIILIVILILLAVLGFFLIAKRKKDEEEENN